jgi:putative Holliday junction resolvase
MARILGIDYGGKRIGLAVCDPEERIASPERVVASRGDVTGDAAAVAAVAAELDAAAFVVGLPLNMDGTEGDQAKRTRAFGDALGAASGKPVHYWDERLSSHAADTRLAGRGLTRGKKKQRQDAVAAAIILTDYLEANRTDETDRA